MIDLKEISAEEWELIMQGLDSIKYKDLSGDMLSMMLEGLVRPDKDAPMEEQQRWEEENRIRKMEKDLKKEENDKILKKIELLKAKILLMVDGLQRIT
jgi:hypothetical protein